MAYEQLVKLQQDLYYAKVPVLLLAEGHGVGRILSDIINILEPRGIEYRRFKPDLSGTGRMMPMRFLESVPAKGRFGIFDGSWYGQLFGIAGENPDRMRKGIKNIIDMERFLTDNGTLLIKVFFRSDGKGDAEDRDCGRIGPDNTSLTCDADILSVITKTDRANAPWDIIDAADRNKAVSDLADVLSERLRTFPKPLPAAETPKYINMRGDTDLSVRFEGDYYLTLKELSHKLSHLQCRLAASDRSLVLVFEGWDAAGKGGAIKRVAHALNPRGYRAIPVGAPTEEELLHNHLWRFCGKVPADGMITIFDRSWYGRMLVEGVEGLCTEAEYERSHTEMILFERILRRSGTIVIKFWMEIDKKEQLKRFKKRKNDPLKEWKLTDDDWRNRSKWDVYEKYVDRMLTLTNTPHAPWIVIGSNNKKHSRIRVLETIIETLEKELD